MNELEWLNDQRPEVEDDELTRAQARRALIEHAHAVAPPVRRRASWRPRIAFVAVAGLVAAGMAVAWPAGDDRSGLPATPLAPEEAVAAPLVRLSQKIAAEPEPKGDATLVQRTHHFPGKPGFTGNDLYLDDGRYYFGSTKAELKASALQHHESDLLTKAAVAADREKMIAATFYGHEVLAEGKLQQDNRVWFGTMDALNAGAGNPDVRAGAMQLLATLPKVKVTESADAITITSADFPDGYEETLVVDPVSGVPKQFLGGTHGKRPDVVVDYEIKRVTAASWADAAAEDGAGQAPVAGGGRSDRSAAPPKPAPEA